MPQRHRPFPFSGFRLRLRGGILRSEAAAGFLAEDA
jgi:hypothetical protein